MGEIFIAALDLEGGGTLLAIVERPAIDTATDKLTRALDSAVGDCIGPNPAPLAGLGGVVVLALILLSS